MVVNRNISYRSTFYIGLDLGQASDYTAISILEKRNPITKVSSSTGERFEGYYYLRHLERPRLGTPYPAIVDRVQELMRSRQLLIEEAHGYTKAPYLIVDATGVGRPVVDLFKQAKLKPIAVTITGGERR